MLILKDITYIHPNREPLFKEISLTVTGKVALIGNNGAGKSTLLKIMAGIISPSAGSVKAGSVPYYVPQVFGQFNDLTVAQCLQVDAKLKALHEILAGEMNDTNLALLNEDWTIEERCRQALAFWQLHNVDMATVMSNLSGGQKTRVLLAGIHIHEPGIILFDEPSNHLDRAGRELLYHVVRSGTQTMVIVSHDRSLLNMLDVTYELKRDGIATYGGNYDFYRQQKKIESEAHRANLHNVEKTLRKAKQTRQETAERQQRRDARGKSKQQKAGLPTISMNTLRNNAEKSTARLKDVHNEKLESIAGELNALRKELPKVDQMKFGFDQSGLHKGKILATTRDVNFTYDTRPLWQQPVNIVLTSGERLSLQGANGSGKTTLLRLLLGELEPSLGEIKRIPMQSVYLDQEYSLIDKKLTAYEQAESFNRVLLKEHELKIRLNRFLFTKDDWDKPCSALSGGERMRLLLCCLNIAHQAPDIIVLDEPTNNLDIENIEILTDALNDYKGTVLAVSHDEHFLNDIGVNRQIFLS